MVAEMNTPKLPPLPKPDTHCFDEDTGKDVWSHSPEQMQAYALAAIEELRAQIGQGVPEIDCEALIAAAELRRLSEELEALKRAINEAQPEAWIVDGQTLGGGVSQYLAWKKSGAGQVPAPLRTDPTPLYTLKGIK